MKSEKKAGDPNKRCLMHSRLNLSGNDALWIYQSLCLAKNRPPAPAFAHAGAAR